ncbi:MAG: hypothetical protein WKF90_11315 [Pyrinomonadaceae bacterium]
MFNPNGQANKSLDVRARAATFFSRCPFPFGLRVIGFAPRHLRRWAAISWYSVEGMKNDKAT